MAQVKQGNLELKIFYNEEVNCQNLLNAVTTFLCARFNPELLLEEICATDYNTTTRSKENIRFCVSFFDVSPPIDTNTIRDRLTEMSNFLPTIADELVNQGVKSYVNEVYDLSLIHI